MSSLSALLAIALSSAAPTYVPTGAAITPEAAPGAVFQTLNPGVAELPDYVVGQAANLSISPDGRTLAILTSGFNRNRDAKGKVVLAASTEFVFLYDISGEKPVKTDVLSLPNSFLGLAWLKDGGKIYASGGVNDTVATFARGSDGHFATKGTIALGHKTGLGLHVQPSPAGLAISPDGARLLVANFQNDSVSLIDTHTDTVVRELDLRPGAASAADHGRSGGTFPRAVQFVGSGKAYVSSPRDRELLALSLDAAGERSVRRGNDTRALRRSECRPPA